VAGIRIYAITIHQLRQKHIKNTHNTTQQTIHPPPPLPQKSNGRPIYSPAKAYCQVKEEPLTAAKPVKKPPRKVKNPYLSQTPFERRRIPKKPKLTIPQASPRASMWSVSVAFAKNSPRTPIYHPHFIVYGSTHLSTYHTLAFFFFFHAPLIILRN